MLPRTLETKDNSIDETEEAGLHSEPLWRNPRFQMRGVDGSEERFLAHDVGITKLGDVLDETTRRPRTISEWRKLLGKLDLSDRWAGHGGPRTSQAKYGADQAELALYETQRPGWSRSAIRYRETFDTCLDSSHAELLSARESLNY